jgi:demethylmenaquinone methyltransferase/2-methoxy-6-polyprenyl-1,4-benzoquinol methylase
VEYYARRAGEYERIYAKPERQEDLATLRELLKQRLAGRQVLEVACGTGYWTQVISESALSVLATDLNQETLEIARRKSYPNRNVRFQLADALSLPDLSGNYTAGLAAFWWSHIPRQTIHVFLEGLHRKLSAGALVVFVDNSFVEGSSTPVARRDETGNSFQKRRLEDGSEFEVMKNFPTGTELRTALGRIADDIDFIQLKYYWLLSYTLCAA